MTAQQQEKVDSIYGEEYEGFRRDEKFESVVREEIERTIVPVVAPPARVLDVGCGNGVFLHAATEAGYECRGIDFSEAAVKICRENGLHAVADDFLTHEWDGPFKLITMWDVVEHLREPEEFLQRAYELLESDGHLLLKIPRWGSLNFWILKIVPARGGLLLGAPGHINYFSRDSFVSMLARTGFAPVSWGRKQEFRGRGTTPSIKRRVGRILKKQVAKLAGDENIFCILRKNGQ